MNGDQDVRAHAISEEPGRVETTLFLLASVDGKITSGESDNLDSDRDWKRIHGVKEGLRQYYETEWAIANPSLNSGRVMAKIGVNTHTDRRAKEENLVFFLIDRKPHLDANGIRYLAEWVGKLILITNNPAHPGFDLQSRFANLEMLFYPGEVDLSDLLLRIRRQYGFRKLVIQSGGTLNAEFVRRGLVDHVHLVVAPLLVGGRNTSSLIDGPSLKTEEDLVNLKALKLVRCEVLADSYLRLEYDIRKETIIDTIP